MSATVASLGTLQVFEIAPERNGWTADIIRRWPRKWMLRPPWGGANAQSKTGQVLVAQAGCTFDRVMGVDRSRGCPGSPARRSRASAGPSARSG